MTLSNLYFCCPQKLGTSSSIIVIRLRFGVRVALFEQVVSFVAG